MMLRCCIAAGVVVASISVGCSSLEPAAEAKSLQPDRQIAEPFVLSAVLLNGQPVGELTLGKTTLAEALQMLPPWPGHPPATISGAELASAPGKVGQMRNRVGLGYNPRMSGHILIFDKRNKLVIIQSIDKRDQLRISSIAERYPQLTEVSHPTNPNQVRLQGDLNDCVTMELFYWRASKPDELTQSAGFIFTCQVH